MRRVEGSCQPVEFGFGFRIPFEPPGEGCLEESLRFGLGIPGQRIGPLQGFFTVLFF